MRFGTCNVVLSVCICICICICDDQALNSAQALPVLYPSLRAVVDRLVFSQLIRILKEFTASLPDSKDTRLTLACQNKVRFYAVVFKLHLPFV